MYLTGINEDKVFYSPAGFWRTELPAKGAWSPKLFIRELVLPSHLGQLLANARHEQFFFYLFYHPKPIIRVVVVEVPGSWAGCAWPCGWGHQITLLGLTVSSMLFTLWKILKEMGLPDHLICLLRNLYAGQESTVRTGHGTTDWFQIEKGVRQGCILSPCLCNLYAEYVMRNAGLEEIQAGIKIAGEKYQ